MATKTKPRPRPARSAAKVTPAPARPTKAKVKAAPPPPKAPPATSKAPLKLSTAAATELPRNPPVTTEEFLQHISLLGKRIEGHVAFMGAIEKMNGTSSEAKSRALSVFYQRLVGMETELARVREELELG